jgi:hypothetical protein
MPRITSALATMTVISKRPAVRVARWHIFKPKNPNLGKFWRVLQWKILVYFMTIWSYLRPVDIFCGHLVHFMVIWYIFSRLGKLYHEKSGNPAAGL